MNQQTQPKVQAEGLILTVGKTADPIVFCLNRCQPKAVVFLVTPESRQTLDEVLGQHPIQPSQMRIDPVEDDPSQIGRLVLLAAAGVTWLQEEHRVPKQRVAIDPTGGRKWMSAGAMMIGSFLGLRVVYVDVRYDKDGKPIRKTMQPLDVGNVYDQTGFLLCDQIEKLCGAHLYEEAAERLEEVHPSLPEQNELVRGLETGCRFLSKWDLAYQWDEKGKGRQELAELANLSAEHLRRFAYTAGSAGRFADEFLARLRQLAEIAKGLPAGGDSPPDLRFVADVLENAKRRLTQHRYDDAVARAYRALEATAQHLLWTKHCLKTKNPEWDKVPPDVKGRFSKSGDYPTEIGLKKQWRLLWAFGDPEANHICKHTGEVQAWWNARLAIRNGSILAHGTERVLRDSASRFLEGVSRVLDRMLEGTEWEDWKEKLTFPVVPADLLARRS